MKIKDFFRRVVSKGDHHMMVWVIVFANLDESISLSAISQKARISKTHVFRIVKWGMEVLKELDVECQYVVDSLNDDNQLSFFSKEQLDEFAKIDFSKFK